MNKIDLLRNRPSAKASEAMMRELCLILALLSPAVAEGKTIPANSYCAALAQLLDATTSAGPAFLRSYQPGPRESDLPGPLRATAFSYDNALAAIALIACGDIERARRIADAFVIVVASDRSGDPIRLRNAYRPGAVVQGDAKLPGWWDAATSRWLEDAYQDGTSTGNAAWVALALLTAHQASPNPNYIAAARELLDWIAGIPASAALRDGYAGGLSGFDGQQQTLHWESTEHNIDVAAAGSWVYRLTGDPNARAIADRASAFVAGRFDHALGRFMIGTKPDGSDADPTEIALDTQVWPVLGVPDAPLEWRKAIDYAYTNLRAGDGMMFTPHGENQWIEGSAQAALSLLAIGDVSKWRRLLSSVARNNAPSGLLYATDKNESPTGLRVEADGGGEFKYFHRPHIGATAWAALASERWNPFTGTRIP